MIFPLKVYDPDQDMNLYLPSPILPIQQGVESPIASKNLSNKASEAYLQKVTSNRNLATLPTQSLEETPITDRKLGSGLSTPGHAHLKFRISPDI
jgi:hypothetical protein